MIATVRWRLLAYSTATAVLLSACSIIPFENPGASAGASTARDTIDTDTSPELVGGVVEREVRITIPSGGLDNAEVAVFSLHAYTRSPEPFSDVAIAVGDPVNETVTIRKVSSPQWEWNFPVPDDCQNGCTIVVPVTLEQSEEGPAPKFSWSANLFFDYGSDTSVPDAASDMNAKIVPAGE